MPRTPNRRTPSGKPTPKPSPNRHRDPRLEDVSDAELHLPPRCEIPNLAEFREPYPVDPAPGTSIVTRQFQHGRFGRVKHSEARLPPPSVEKVEYVVDVCRELERLAR